MRIIHQVNRESTPPPAPCSNERGQALVEAALTFPLLFLLFFGIIEFSLVVLSYNTISNAAREGARYGIIHPADTTGITSHARSLTTAIQCSGGMTITPHPPTEPSGTVQVNIDCNVPMITQMMVQALGGTGTIPLHASATMHVE
jgi:Flp pilus assembly protein TadG